MPEFAVRLRLLPLIHLIGITEVKSKSHKQQMIPTEFNLDDIEDYNIFSRNIENDIGRGLLLYVHKTLEAKEMVTVSEFQESIFVKIKCSNNENMIIGLIYRSNSGTESNNYNLLGLLEEVSIIKHSYKLIMGDFNLPNIDWRLLEVKENNPISLDNRFLDCIQNVWLFQHVLEPTRWRGGDTPHVLDLIVTNEEHMIDDIQYLSPLGNSDHCVLLFKVICYTQMLNNVPTKRNYNKANYDEARRGLENFDWKSHLSNYDVNGKSKLKEIEEKCVPIVKIRSNNNNKKYFFPLDDITKAKRKEKK